MRPGRSAKRTRRIKARDRLAERINIVLKHNSIQVPELLARLRQEYQTLEERTR